MTKPSMTPPIMADGFKMLKDIALQADNTTGLVFHGSSRVVDVLDPKPVYWKDRDGLLYEDSQVPVVCASDMPFIPTFMALVPREADWGYISNGHGNGLSYYIERSFKRNFVESVGYVLALKSHTFRKTVPDIPSGWNYDLPLGGRQPEMRSECSVSPTYAIKVTYADFEELLRIADDSEIVYR